MMEDRPALKGRNPSRSRRFHRAPSGLIPFVAHDPDLRSILALSGLLHLRTFGPPLIGFLDHVFITPTRSGIRPFHFSEAKKSLALKY
jgi:hypothetical protein